MKRRVRPKEGSVDLYMEVHLCHWLNTKIARHRESFHKAWKRTATDGIERNRFHGCPRAGNVRLPKARVENISWTLQVFNWALKFLRIKKCFYLHGVCLLIFTILKFKNETPKDTYSFNNDNKSNTYLYK